MLILLQGLLLVGLCPIEQPKESRRWRWHDPVEWLLSHAPPAWGNVSYAQYILQFLAYAVWPREHLTSWWAVSSSHRVVAAELGAPPPRLCCMG